MIYKFRMLMEGNDTFMREYELKVTDSFESFHNLIQSTVKFKTLELASFFICDSEWSRMQEITLLDMVDAPQTEDDIPLAEVITMNEALLKDFMEEPRQRIIYEYDFLKPKTFYIELSGIVKSDADGVFPRCTYSRGEAESIAPPSLDENEPEELLEDEDYADDFQIDGLDELLRDLGTDDITIVGPEEE